MNAKTPHTNGRIASTPPDGLSALSPAYAELPLHPAGELVALIDGEGRYCFVAATYRRLGYEPADLLRQPYTDYVHPDDRALAHERWQALPHVGSAELIVRFRAHDGSWRRLTCRMDAVAPDDDLRAVLVARDLDDLREHEEYLLQVQRSLMVSALATGMISELNNLLTVIAGHAELAAEMLPDDHPAQAELATLSAVTAHAGNLANQVSAYGHERQSERRPLQLGQVLAEQHTLIERLAGPLISVSSECAPDLWPVFGTPHELSQAILNLVAHARATMPAGGAIRISARNAASAALAGRCTGAAVVIEVSATGPGRSDTAQQQRFEPFGGALSPSGQVRIGLAGARRIVHLHGGDLQLAGAVGRSTTVSITLPRA
jgi:signal transduction histidine kinase